MKPYITYPEELYKIIEAHSLNISFLSEAEVSLLSEKLMKLTENINCCEMQLESNDDAIGLFTQYPITGQQIAFLYAERQADIHTVSIMFRLSDQTELQLILRDMSLIFYPVYITDDQSEYLLLLNGYDVVRAYGTAREWLNAIGETQGYRVKCFDKGVLIQES
jgi:hypothetical protein